MQEKRHIGLDLGVKSKSKVYIIDQSRGKSKTRVFYLDQSSRTRLHDKTGP